MSPAARKVLYWAPRTLTILFACFVSSFALDVFGPGQSFWETAVALAMHLVPTAVLVAVLVFAWRWEWVGAVLYAAAAGWYCYWARHHVIWILTLAVPLFAIAALWLVNWLRHAELRARS